MDKSQSTLEKLMSTYPALCSIAYSYKILIQLEFKANWFSKKSWILSTALSLCTQWCFGVFNTVFFCNEASFQLDRYTNPQNYLVWSSENPQVFQTASLHPPKNLCLVCHESQTCRGINFLRQQLLQRYIAILKHNFFVLLHKDEHDAVFQQENVRPHGMKDTMFFLVDFLGANLQVATT